MNLNIDIMDNDMLAKNKNIEFIGEERGNDSRNIKCLNFRYNDRRFETEIKIILEESEEGLDFQLIFENICKDIQIDDSVMQEIIIGISNISRKIEDKVISLDNTINMNLDTMIIDENILENCYINDGMSKFILEMYEEFKPNKVEYNDYTNKLLLFGVKGAEIAKLFNNLLIATVTKTRSGYLINFCDKKVNRSNTFINNFANSLSNKGIPSLSIPLISLDYLWVD
ncbi:hypothetical protein [Clostridium sp. C2-6-12]|uniref:hypothetical protein n=1 Tax=Clostridium sp. C2-6-12 TaxID=2698832 RepID=UPI00136E0F5D|nr:hypothetical protein [Clostridium sp. C2-6-12]